MIIILVNGAPFADFTSVECRVSIESVANDFSFTASAVAGFPPFKVQDVVTIRVDGVTVTTGRISRVSGRDAEGGHEVIYSGRDFTSDLIDSSIDTLGDVSADQLTLKRLAELVIRSIGSPLRVVDQLPATAPFSVSADFIAPQVGEPALAFLQKYAQKRQALLSSTGAGDLLLTQSQGSDSGAILQSVKGSNSNNIVSHTWAVDVDTLFNRYITRGQLDPRALNFSGEVTTDALVTQWGSTTDPDVPPGRQFVSVQAGAYSNDDLQSLAEWARQLARAKSTRLTCTVHGHSFAGTGQVWAENTLVRVNSEPADISTLMLIATVTFTQREGEGSLSTLELVERDVYTIDEQIRAAKPAGKQNDVYWN
jgi:prophage tail gpP-like protein